MSEETDFKKEWDEKTLITSQKAIEKLNIFFDANKDYTEKTSAEREKVATARRAAIRALASIPGIQFARQEMRENKRFFTDMITERNKFEYKDIMIYPLSETEINEQNTIGDYRADLDAIGIPLNGGYCGNLLHEMIHLHIEKMNGAERASCYIDLLHKVKNKVPYFDRIFSLRDIVLADITTKTALPDPRAHDNLFFVKSIDLDLRRKYKLGTVYGYGMTSAIEIIQEGKQ